MVKKKIKINTKATREIDKYPLVSVYWLDICSDSSWQSLEGCKKAKLPICVTKGHLLTQTKGVTRIFGDYSLADDETGKIEECALECALRTKISRYTMNFHCTGGALDFK